MSKIQAVICPQCGSVDLKSLGDDKFQCGSCRATYFIDKEKVEVHVKHSFDSPKPAGEPISSSSLKKNIRDYCHCFRRFIRRNSRIECADSQESRFGRQFQRCRE